MKRLTPEGKAFLRFAAKAIAEQDHVAQSAPRPLRKLVLAINHPTYEDWRRHHGLRPQEAAFINRPEHLMGNQGGEFVLLEGWWRNPNYNNDLFRSAVEVLATHGMKIPDMLADHCMLVRNDFPEVNKTDVDNDQRR